MTSETTIEDRIAARIARIADARDQVVRTLVADLKASIRGAEAGGQVANPLERLAVEVLERLIGVELRPVEVFKPRPTPLEWCRDWLISEGFDCQSLTRIEVCKLAIERKPPSLLGFLTEEINRGFTALPVPENALQFLTVHHILNDDIHGFCQAIFNTKSPRRRRLTRAEKIAASKAGA